MIEEQKRAYFEENVSESMNSTSEIEENEDRCYDTPQIFIHQLFKLYKKGLVDDKNIRDQVYLMVIKYNAYSISKIKRHYRIGSISIRFLRAMIRLH